jgi:hypothetical protein
MLYGVGLVDIDGERARATSSIIKGDPVISIFMTTIQPNFFTRTTTKHKNKHGRAPQPLKKRRRQQSCRQK